MNEQIKCLELIEKFLDTKFNNAQEVVDGFLKIYKPSFSDANEDVMGKVKELMKSLRIKINTQKGGKYKKSRKTLKQKGGNLLTIEVAILAAVIVVGFLNYLNTENVGDRTDGLRNLSLKGSAAGNPDVVGGPKP